MESQPQNPEFRNNPENFHPCHKPDQYNKRLIEHMLLPHGFEVSFIASPWEQMTPGAWQL